MNATIVSRLLPASATGERSAEGGVVAERASVWEASKPRLQSLAASAMWEKKSSGGGIRTPDTRIMIPLL
jgi:hypothetical protein